jgi:hypothetical protein
LTNFIEMVKNAGSAAIKRDEKNPQTINSHESALRSRIVNPEDPRMDEHLQKVKDIVKSEKLKLEIND